MTNVDKRNYVYNLYDGPKWKKRVSDMPNDQIFAIYMSDKRKKEVDLAAKEAAKKNPIDTLF